MKYKWIEKGTRFNGKDYLFSIEEFDYYKAVLVTCQYGSYVTQTLVDPSQEAYWTEILDEMKELLYNKNYI